jgi:cytochrome c oxidase subunit 2
VFDVTAVAPPAVPPPAAAPAATPGRRPAAKTAARTPDAEPLVRPVSDVKGSANSQPAASPDADSPTIVQGATQASDGDVFPRDSLRPYNIPTTPTPDGLTFTPGLVGDPGRGQKVYSISACIGCHTIKGNPNSVGITGPNLTHVGSRFTIAAGLYPNDTEHLRLWIKNAREMKAGVLMLTLGLNQIDPQTGAKVTVGGLTDQQIADIAAYLQALK